MSWRFILGCFVIFILSLTLRLPELAQRPMHTDEAVHAVKFGQLVEDGEYTYDPFEYHGPTLNYFTLVPAWLAGVKTYPETTEILLRSVPLFFGILLVLLTVLLRIPLGNRTTLILLLLTAVSPGLVFFSRYYIMEILLVCFTLAAFLGGYWFFRTGKCLPAVLTGLALGLMHATKETAAMVWFAALAALIWGAAARRQRDSFWNSETLRRAAIGIVSGAVISMLFFSSFGGNWGGIWDSVYTYFTYFKRGAGGFDVHVYPWRQYLQWLWQSGEWLFVALGLGGIWMSFFRPQILPDAGFAKFISRYTLILTLIYFLIPYKTPWSMLGFMHGWMVLAAVGVAGLFQFEFKWKKILGAGMLVVIAAGLVYKSWQLNYPMDADPRNPYVYGHTSDDIYRLVDAVREVSDASSVKNDIYIEVIAPGGDYWPLPWYLRDYPNVGYWSEVNVETPAAPIIIAKPAVEDRLITKLYEIPPPGKRNMYIPFFEHGVDLRLAVELDMYVVKSLYDQWWRLQP